MKFILLFFIGSITFCFSQKDEFIFLNQEIDSIIKQKGYDVAKKRLKHYNRKYEVQPSVLKDFLSYSLESNDITYFKKGFKFLSKNYGFYVVKNDTIDIEWKYNSDIIKKIYEANLIDWSIKKSKKRYSKWASNHLDEIEVNEKLYSLEEKDQFLRFICAKFSHLDSSYAERMIKHWDYELFLELLTVYKSNDSIMPNEFDNGVGKAEGWLIIWHNLKDPKKIELVWNLLLPYVEKTYETGKIGKHYFQTYDYWLNEFFGEQFYGTLTGVPIRDEENFLKRKIKYRL